MEMEIDITVSVQCEGTYEKGTPAVYNEIHGNWLPGEEDEISDFKVFLVKTKTKAMRPTKIEITDVLNKEEYERLYNEMLSQERDAQ